MWGQDQRRCKSNGSSTVPGGGFIPNEKVTQREGWIDWEEPQLGSECVRYVVTPRITLEGNY